MVDMIPSEQSNVTPTEMHIAGVIDHLIKPVFEAIASTTGRGEIIESKDVAAVEKLIEAKAKQFFPPPN